ncbi:hypothetical protein QZH41_001979 [Actinostola sp. cb2023]|nr:hypothetical protein QZH41_001979 [Actinostola sp. cb2023]
MITIDWHMFIVHALRYYEIVRRRYVLIALITAWLVNSAIALVRLAWVLEVDVTDDGDDVHQQETIYNLFCLGLFLLLMAVNVVLDSHMLIILSRQVNKIIKHNLTRQCLEHENRMRANRRRAVVMCALMLVMNVILWLPYFSYDLWQEHGSLSIEGEYIIQSVRILSSFINPIIYSVGQRSLRKVIRKKLRYLFPCKPNRDCKTEEIPLNE